MSDVVELFLVSLAVVLGGAAFALGAQVIRTTWQEARRAAHPDTRHDTAGGEGPGQPG